MFVDTQYRSNADEIMDDFDLEGEILREALDKIAGINRLLGGNKITIEGIANLISSGNKKALIRILDVGCGNGDMLRAIAEYGRKKGLNFQLTGMEAEN